MLWDIDKQQEDSYLAACKLFASEDDAFNSFKQNGSYNNILEHLSYEDSMFYADRIDRAYITEENLQAFKENDAYGSPAKNEYESLGDFSPSTVRYIKNASDILRKFGKIDDGCKLVEIGGGYGGLAKTISSVISYGSYTLIDQPEVNLLSKKYIGKFASINKHHHWMNCYEMDDIYDIDLLISNYAVSELSIDSQQEYYDKVIRNADRIYITYNVPGLQNSFTEILSNDFVLDSEDDHRDNKIIYGIKK